MGMTTMPCGCRVKDQPPGSDRGKFDHLCLTHRLAHDSQMLLLEVHAAALSRQSLTLDTTPGGLLDRIKRLCRQLI